jgi:hypothetical protein
MKESKSQSMGRQRMVLTVTSGPKAIDNVMGEPEASFRGVKVGGIADSAAKLNGFERVRGVEG